MWNSSGFTPFLFFTFGIFVFVYFLKNFIQRYIKHIKNLPYIKRQDEILARVNELRCPLTIIPPNVNGLFLRGYHFKLRYVIIVVIAILAWAVAASVSSIKYKEESFAHYSMYRAIKEQHQYLMERISTKVKRSTE